jgi:hypothetical protein
MYKSDIGRSGWDMKRASGERFKKQIAEGERL